MSAMTWFDWPLSWHWWHWWRVAAFGLGLVLTLALASWLTPRHWWRRPTARNLALAGGGTLAFGALFAALFAAWFAALPPATSHAEPPASLTTAWPAPLVPAAQALRYRVVEDLNLRAARATGAPRLAVLPAGTLVQRTGATDGDWWQVRARLKGRQVEGWTSSLWLRRVDERAVQH
jgi:hypothetical protein